MSDSDENRTVSIFIDRIYIPEFSRLLYPIYDNVKVYVDWFFLDYPLEESRTPTAIPLPRIPDSPGLFVHKKEFHLSRRRVALLDQWLELGNRLDFTLITEGEDSEELAVAQLELSRTATDETTTIQCTSDACGLSMRKENNTFVFEFFWTYTREAFHAD
ncbi:hypothetical protein COOONC_21348 [Cooperia oncophora]